MTTRVSVSRIRAFNRYYTRVLGLLDGEYAGSGFTLVEARVLYEIRREEGCTAKRIREAMGIDAGYLSRTLGSLTRRGFLSSEASGEDGRCRVVELTRKGEAAYRALDRRSSASIEGMIKGLSAAEREELVRCLERASSLIGEVDPPAKEAIDG
jgi:DNA-binding MarR family transcriptional regulator